MQLFDCGIKNRPVFLPILSNSTLFSVISTVIFINSSLSFAVLRCTFLLNGRWAFWAQRHSSRGTEVLEEKKTKNCFLFGWCRCSNLTLFFLTSLQVIRWRIGVKTIVKHTCTCWDSLHSAPHATEEEDQGSVRLGNTHKEQGAFMLSLDPSLTPLPLPRQRD